MTIRSPSTVCNNCDKAVSHLFPGQGAPGEGQGDPGARRRPEDPGNVVKPIGNLWKTGAKAI